MFVLIFFVCTFVSLEWLQDSLGREGGRERWGSFVLSLMQLLLIACDNW